MPTFADWDRRVLAHPDDRADFIGLHPYVGNCTDDTRDDLAIGNRLDRQIEDIAVAVRG